MKKIGWVLAALLLGAGCSGEPDGGNEPGSATAPVLTDGANKDEVLRFLVEQGRLPAEVLQTGDLNLPVGALTDRERYVLTGLGLDPKAVNVTADAVFLQGDIRLERSQIAAMAESKVDKGYALTSLPDPDDPTSGATVPMAQHPSLERICLVDTGLEDGWSPFVREAARHWSNQLGQAYFVDGPNDSDFFTPGIDIEYLTLGEPFDNCGYFVFAFMFDAVDNTCGGSIACANPPFAPGFCDSSAVCAGGLSFFWIQRGLAPASLHLPLHELGHTFGLTHPDQGDNLYADFVPGTTMWPYDTVMWSGPAASPPEYQVLQTFGTTEDMYTTWAYNQAACGQVWDPAQATADECGSGAGQCRCGHGMGDCDSSDDCKQGLYCDQDLNNGGLYSIPGDLNYDVCVKPSSCPAQPKTDPWDYCNDPDCPCGVGEGDCDPEDTLSSNLGCGGFLECGQDIGFAAGLVDSGSSSNRIDVCRFPRPIHCPEHDQTAPGSCGADPSCPCRLGEGDCNTDDDCRGSLVCMHDVGEDFGLPAGVDVCVLPEVKNAASCNEDTAIDLGAPGNDVTVANNACIRVRDGYPSWWAVRRMKLENPSAEAYPVPFTWDNGSCGGNGGDVYTANWQAKYLPDIDSSCATVIKLNGLGDKNITLRYWAE